MTEKIKAGQTNQEQSKKVRSSQGGAAVALRDAVSELLVPIGIQIMGPFWEDATPIEFAALLSNEMGGFKAPSGYGA